MTPTDKKILTHLYDAEQRTVVKSKSHNPHGLNKLKERTNRATSRAIGIDNGTVGKRLNILMEMGLITRELPRKRVKGFEIAYVYSLTAEGRKEAHPAISCITK